MTLTLPETDSWEILVVDNNSNDATPEVIAEFCERYPNRVHYLFEAKPGKSHALNSGIREAGGDVLAFMDDDVIVEANWLRNLTASLESDDWAGAGGRIVPESSCKLPRWLSLSGRYALAPLAMFDLGEVRGVLDDPPFGTNMAFRREVFEKYGDFRTDLGPRPNSEIRNEDTEYGLRLLRAGERLRYEPSAVVYHPVSEARLRKDYFLAWWLAKGQADIRQYGIRPKTRYYVGGVPLYMFRNLVVWTLRWSFAVGSRRRFSYKLHVWKKIGEIVECHNQAHPETSINAGRLIPPVRNKS